MSNFEKEKYTNLETITEEAGKKAGSFLKKAFEDMKQSARAQHEVDKAQLEAHKAEARAQWEEARMTPAGRQALMQDQREEQIKEARERAAAAQARIDLAKTRQ